MRPSFLAVAFCAALSGCESGVSLDLSVADSSGLDSVNISIESADLLAEDGELYSLTSAAASLVELRDLIDGALLTLSNEQEVASTSYKGFRLDFGDADGLVRLSDGREAALSANVLTEFADISFDLDEDESVRLIAVLDLRFSLYGDADSGYTLNPWLRVVDTDRASSISGKLDAAAVESTSCMAGRQPGEGVAVYLYRGEVDTLLDFATGLSGPFASAPVRTSSASYVYDLPYLPAGTYTLGWTCAGDSDNPEIRDGLLIEHGSTLTLEDNEAVIIDL